MAEYKLSLPAVMRRLPLTTGLTLFAARHERINPGSAPMHVDELAMRAADAEQARIEREYTII